MNPRKFSKSENKEMLPDSIVKLVIKAAYRDASVGEIIKVYALTLRYPQIKKLLNEYKATAGSVHSIKIDECPSGIIKNLPYESVSGKPSVINDLYTAIFAKPVFTMAAITILAVAVITSVIIRNNYEYEGYKKTEVELAARQTQYALGVIGKVFKSTKHTLVNDIIPVKVTAPINEGIETVNKLFKSQGEIK